MSSKRKRETQSAINSYFTSSSSSSCSSLSASRKRNAVSRTTQSTSNTSNNEQCPYHIFIDLDGVLVDFEAGVRNLTGKTPENLPSRSMWAAISKTPSFYEHLPWTHDGKLLWNSLKAYYPEILTGVPMSRASREQKARWCQREFASCQTSDSNDEMPKVKVNHVDMAGGKSAHKNMKGIRCKRINDKGKVNVITCWSKNKHYESGANRILIDDRESLSEAWEEKGGIFVHHTSTENTLCRLRDLGIVIKGETKSESDEKVASVKRKT